MSDPIRELWSSADAESQRSLGSAVAGGDLLGVLLAVEGLDAATRGRVDDDVADLAARVRELVETMAPHEALARVIAVERGVTGDAEDYYHPDNSLLSRVLARRRGLPILVSSLWVVVGRAAGLEVDGVALPGHFVARVGDVFVDPFADGAVLTEDDCVRIVRSFGPARPWDPAWLEPASVAQIAERVLRNLVHSHHHLGDKQALYRVMRLLSGLVPHDAAAQLNLAQLTEEFGAYRLASRLYQTIAATFDGRREAQIAAIRAVEISSRSRTLN